MAADLAKLECKIVDIEAMPPLPDRPAGQIVSIHFKLGTKEWFKGFRMAYDRPISMEEFKRELIRVGIWPEDFLAYIKVDRDKPFELEAEVPDYIEP